MANGCLLTAALFGGLRPFFAVGLFDKPNNNTKDNNVTSAA